MSFSIKINIITSISIVNFLDTVLNPGNIMHIEIAMIASKLSFKNVVDSAVKIIYDEDIFNCTINYSGFKAKCFI